MSADAKSVLTDDDDDYIKPGKLWYNNSDSTLCSDPSRNYSIEMEVCCCGEDKCSRPIDKAGLIRCHKCSGWFHEGLCGDAHPSHCNITLKETFVYICSLCEELKTTMERDNDWRKRKTDHVTGNTPKVSKLE